MTMPKVSALKHRWSRDLVGTLAPFTAFLILVIVADPGGSERIAQLRLVLPESLIGGIALGLGTYLLVGLVVGKLVGAIAIVLTRWATHLPSVGRQYSYADWYRQNQAAIEELYTQLFENLPRFELSLTDKVNALKSYYLSVHAEGHDEVARQFMLVDITRGAFVYSTLLVLYELCERVPHPSLALVCAMVLLITAQATPRRIQKVVRAEMVYLVAAARIKQDLSASQTRAGKPPARKTT